MDLIGFEKYLKIVSRVKTNEELLNEDVEVFTAMRKWPMIFDTTSAIPPCRLVVKFEEYSPDKVKLAFV